jgi:hypothetical protein
MWYIWREHYAQNFKDSEETVADLKVFIFNPLYNWMDATSMFNYSKAQGKHKSDVSFY